MKKPWQIMTSGDWLVVIVVFGVALVGMAMVAMAPAGARVMIESDGRLHFSADLDRHQEVAIEGPLGESRLVIDDAGVRMLSSPCPRKLCVSMGPAKTTSDLIACVPNRILVRVDGVDSKAEGTYDLLSR